MAHPVDRRVPRRTSALPQPQHRPKRQNFLHAKPPQASIQPPHYPIGLPRHLLQHGLRP
jgi:hypothetical protein